MQVQPVGSLRQGIMLPSTSDKSDLPGDASVVGEEWRLHGALGTAGLAVKGPPQHIAVERPIAIATGDVLFSEDVLRLLHRMPRGLYKMRDWPRNKNWRCGLAG